MSDLGADYQRLIREEARLIILKAIAEQDDESLPSGILEEVLPLYGVNRPRAWIHQQMAYLAEMGAITTSPRGSVVTGRLTELGRRHLDRHAAIEGVKRPARKG